MLQHRKSVLIRHDQSMLIFSYVTLITVQNYLHSSVHTIPRVSTEKVFLAISSFSPMQSAESIICCNRAVSNRMCSEWCNGWYLGIYWCNICYSKWLYNNILKIGTSYANILFKFKITDILHEANPVLSQNKYSLKKREVHNIKSFRSYKDV